MVPQAAQRPARIVLASTCAAVLLASRVAADTGTTAAVSERAELVMGTVARLAIYGPRADPAAFATAFAALRAVDAQMSLYVPTSELVRVNAHAALHAEPIGADLYTLLARARVLSDETDGAFDVTVLPLLRLWGAYPALGGTADRNRDAVGFAGLQLDPVSRTVSFRRPGMAVDLGGIAKGFALDRARDALAVAGVHAARLDLGGELAFLGRGPEGVWRVAVRDPQASDQARGVLALGPDVAVSTSSNYARDFAVEGWRARSHIYDPRTGRPVLAPVAVTVWAPDATTADALSTALVVVGRAGAAAVLAREPMAGALFVDTADRGRAVHFEGCAPLGWEDGAPVPAAAAS
jgi:thiamine biosynthesis lipoprotein